MMNIESNDLLLSYDDYEVSLESGSPYLKYHMKPTLLLQHYLEKVLSQRRSRSGMKPTTTKDLTYHLPLLSDLCKHIKLPPNP